MFVYSLSSSYFFQQVMVRARPAIPPHTTAFRASRRYCAVGVCCACFRGTFNGAQRCPFPKEKCPLCLPPGGEPWGTPLQLEIRDIPGPLQSPLGGQTLRSPRPKVTSVIYIYIYISYYSMLYSSTLNICYIIVCHILLLYIIFCAYPKCGPALVVEPRRPG